MTKKQHFGEVHILRVDCRKPEKPDSERMWGNLEVTPNQNGQGQLQILHFVQDDTGVGWRIRAGLGSSSGGGQLVSFLSQQDYCPKSLARRIAGECSPGGLLGGGPALNPGRVLWARRVGAAG